LKICSELRNRDVAAWPAAGYLYRIGLPDHPDGRRGRREHTARPR
jgi:hypothetical protein